MLPTCPRPWPRSRRGTWSGSRASATPRRRRARRSCCRRCRARSTRAARGRRPCLCLRATRRATFSSQPVPSRHGVHWPHDSCAKNFMIRHVAFGISVWSSITTMPPEPAIVRSGVPPPRSNCWPGRTMTGLMRSSVCSASNSHGTSSSSIVERRHRHAARDHGLDLATLPDAAAHLVDDLRGT